MQMFTHSGTGIYIVLCLCAEALHSGVLGEELGVGLCVLWCVLCGSICLKFKTSETGL